MKVGDKVYCIRSHYGYYTIFLKDSIYDVSDIIFAAGELVYVIRYEEQFGLQFFERGVSTRTFSDYFIDMKVLRKLKLDKINESR